jgi:hypothetical protein
MTFTPKTETGWKALAEFAKLQQEHKKLKKQNKDKAHGACPKCGCSREECECDD